MLKTQECHGVVWRVWELDSQWSRLQSESGVWEPRALGQEEINAPAQHLGGERENPPFSTVLFYSVPQQIEWCLHILGRRIHFTQFTDSHKPFLNTEIMPSRYLGTLWSSGHIKWTITTSYWLRFSGGHWRIQWVYKTELYNTFDTYR